MFVYLLQWHMMKYSLLRYTYKFPQCITGFFVPPNLTICSSCELDQANIPIAKFPNVTHTERCSPTDMSTFLLTRDYRLVFFWFFFSENRQNIWRTGHTPRHITWLTTNKETPPLLALTRLRQLFQPEKLANRTPVASEQDLVQHQPFFGCRPRLEAGLVACHGGEILPHPLGHFFGLLHAAKAVGEGGLVGFELGGG